MILWMSEYLRLSALAILSCVCFAQTSAPPSTANGDAAADYVLGKKYADGQGVPRDEDEALAFFHHAGRPRHAETHAGRERGSALEPVDGHILGGRGADHAGGQQATRQHSHEG